MPAGLLHEEKEELMSKKKQSINYLDLIPQRAETLRWHTDEATGLITLEVENTGVFNTIAQKVFHKPRTTQVHLDETGSYLWPLIDGQKTVAQLADCMKQQFGEKAEPLYPRIIKYFQIVESYHFIFFLKKKQKTLRRSWLVESQCPPLFLFFFAAPIYRICGHGILSSAPSLFEAQRATARGKSDRR